MLFSDTYRTIAQASEGIFRDRGSKFIGYAFPIRSEAETREIISRLRTEHPKARHFCTAFRLSPDRSVFRINDDGEPSGSAGRPILNTILSADLTNILVVVVRYFGGTLLGVPGLINAYKTATAEALSTAVTIEKTINDVYRLQFEYLQMNDVMKIIKDEGLHVLNQQFDNSCALEFEVPQSRVNVIVGKFEKIENLSVQYIQTL
jgi:uncharacterized YigZ family protein